MLQLSNWQSFPPDMRGGVLCIGNFDGVHVGHAQMLSTGKSQAKRRNAPFTIMTFDPHPSVLLKPNSTRVPLTTPDQRRELLAAFNPDALIIIPTTKEFLAITPEAFLTDIVTSPNALNAKLIVEGPSFTFGKGAKGNPQTLQQLGPNLNLQTLIVPTQQVTLSDLTLVNVSSSLTRWLIEHGRVKDAAQCLGRPYTLRGKIIRGEGRGKTLGFPTANLAISQLIPAPGIYAGHATLLSDTSPSPHLAAISIGTNPTFHGTTLTIEAHLLDFNADLYEQTLDLTLTHWLRETLPFAGPKPLITQIQKDIQQIRALPF